MNGSKNDTSKSHRYPSKPPCLSLTGKDRKGRATQHDVIRTFRPTIKHAKLFGNGGFTPPEAEELPASGTIDGVMFGIPYIAHPDLAKRVLHGKPLDNVPDVQTFYGDRSFAAERGFTDYPAARY
ncbi:hypothetical protein C8R45DRAFT_950776 [Mycena sanguinolenta]|nr:hypothetical protein C8R45DRAFT_950776 [Mycena sanguinolenta]